MEKHLLPERALVNTINLALTKDWPHKDRPCRVESLKKASQPICNWAVDTDSVSGPDLRHAAECDKLRRRVIDEMAQKYDVLWPEKNP